MRRATRGSAIALAAAIGIAAGWCGNALTRPAAAALQGQTVGHGGGVTSIAVCFGTASAPSGWSLPAASADTLAKGNFRIVAVVPAAGPPGCPNPQIVWAQTQ
jgi:hypothetical protein